MGNNAEYNNNESKNLSCFQQNVNLIKTYTHLGAANNSKCFGELGCLEISERW